MDFDFISCNIIANHMIQADLKQYSTHLSTGKFFPLLVIYTPAPKVYFGRILLIIAAGHMIQSHISRSTSGLYFLFFFGLTAFLQVLHNCRVTANLLDHMALQSGYITSCCNKTVLKASSRHQGCGLVLRMMEAWC